MSESKIQIKVGIVEFSGEGDPEWLSTQIDKILEKVPLLLKLELTPPSTGGGKAVHHLPAATHSGSSPNLSMAGVAAKLKSKSAQGLVTAAAAYLRFVQGKASFSRDEILDSMKLATGYFEKNYINNLSTTLLALIRNDTLVQAANKTYALHATKETELDAALK